MVILTQAEKEFYSGTIITHQSSRSHKLASAMIDSKENFSDAGGWNSQVHKMLLAQQKFIHHNMVPILWFVYFRV